MDKDKNHNNVLRITVRRSLVSIVIVTVLVLLGLALVNIPNGFLQNYSGDGAGFVYILKNYWYYFLAYYIIEIFFEFGLSVSRGMDKLSHVAVGGFMNSALVLILNLLFLLVFRWGLDGYFIAYLISMTIASVYLLVCSGIFKRQSERRVDKSLENDMLEYSKPMVFSTVGWWVTNASDRYIVTFLCGVAANGVYSVAYKIPSLLGTIHGIFNQAWVISAVKTFDKDDKDGFFKNIYAVYNIIMVVGCSFLILTTKLIADILFKDNFYEAWQYVPFLLIASVFGGISGVLGGVFTSAKKTRIMGRAAVIGGVTNIVLNFVLISGINVNGIAIIPAMGIQGAAVATMISYVLIWVLRMREAKKMMTLKINLARDVISYFVLLGQAVAFLTIGGNDLLLYGLQFASLLVLVLMYAREGWVAGQAVYKRVKKELKSGIIKAKQRVKHG